MAITFAGTLRQALVYCVHLSAEPFSYADSKQRRAALSHGSTDLCCFHQSGYFFSSLIDGCLKYKNKKKHKTGPRPELWRENCPEAQPYRGVKKSGPISPGPKCRALHWCNAK